MRLDMSSKFEQVNETLRDHMGALLEDLRRLPARERALPASAWGIVTEKGIFGHNNSRVGKAPPMTAVGASDCVNPWELLPPQGDSR